jgi:hypothetical protein
MNRVPGLRLPARLLALGAVIAIAFAAGLAVANQPHMQNALGALETARSELQAAEADKAGHRKHAINLVNQAIEQVREGIAAAGY